MPKCAAYPKHFRLKGPCSLCGHDPSAPRKPVMRERVAWLLAGCLAVTFLWLLATSPGEPPEELTAGAPPDCAQVWRVDVSGDAGLYPVAGSLRPLKGQKKAPCHKYEVEVNGHCWMPHALKPPCPSEMAEHNEQCIIPVAAMPKSPTSIQGAK